MKSMLCAGLLTLALFPGDRALAETFVLVVREAPAEFAKRGRTDDAGKAYWAAWAARAPAALEGRTDVHGVPASPAMAK